MEDFKQYLSEDSDDSERAAAETVRDGLAGLKLEHKVAEVAAERRAWLRRRLWVRVSILVATLVVSTGVAFWFLGKNEPAEQKKTEQPTIQQPYANDNHSDTPSQTPPQQPEEKIDNGPIAQNNEPDRLPAPRFPSPNVRGQNSDNKAWKAMIDKLWYTEYPSPKIELSVAFSRAHQLLKARDFNNAYVQLQRLERKLPENDTLQFLKGYCLMEMGEGAEALAYFEKLEDKQPSWNSTIQWYQGLSSLLTGDREKALSVFTKIAAEPRHPYRMLSKRAIQVLNE